MTTFPTRTRHRLWGLGTIAVTAVAVLAALGSSPAVAAATSTYTWSGGDSASGGSTNWSDAANWSGDAAPPVGSKLALDFPALDCGSTCPNVSTNDLTRLKVDTLALHLVGQEGSGQTYDISGDGLKIGTLSVISLVPSGTAGQGANLGLPLSLLGPETWSVDIEDGSNFNLGAVSGPAADGLTVNLPVADTSNGGGFLGVPSFESGPLSFEGVSGEGSTYVTGASSFNGRTHQSVTFTDSSLFETGPGGGTTPASVTIHYGPLSIAGTTVFFGNGSGGPYGIDSVDGNASLDSASHLNFNALEPGAAATPTAGLSYPQLKATGTVTLGSASLGLFAACDQTIGASYTLVRAGSVSGTFQGLPNNTVVQAGGDGSSSCSTDPAPYVRIRYTATSVVATVVTAPSSVSAARSGVSTSALVPHWDGHAVVLGHES